MTGRQAQGHDYMVPILVDDGSTLLVGVALWLSQCLEHQTTHRRHGLPIRSGISIEGK